VAGPLRSGVLLWPEARGSLRAECTGSNKQGAWRPLTWSCRR